MLTHDEERAIVADLRAQERGGDKPSLPPHTLSPGYVRCAAGMHPHHGEPATFAPGQLLPDWAAAALLDQRPEPTDDGVYELKERGK
jgi:hypothetical protein